MAVKLNEKSVETRTGSIPSAVLLDGSFQVIELDESTADESSGEVIDALEIMVKNKRDALVLEEQYWNKLADQAENELQTPEDTAKRVARRRRNANTKGSKTG